MKILIINSRMFLSAGPEKYLFGLKEILEKKGHEIIFFSVKNSKNIKTSYDSYYADPIGGKDKVYYKDYKKDPKTIIQMLGRQFYSFHVKKKLKELIQKTKPDVAYLLHHYNKLSPSVIDACREEGLKVVMRLSDFFYLCPEGHLFREGKVCSECMDHSLLRSVRHRCVKGSLPASAVKAGAMKFHRMIGIYGKVHTIISPSRFTLELMEGKIDVPIKHIPTFMINKKKLNSKTGRYALYVGRLEESKGIMTAIEAVRGTGYPLKIVGRSSTGYEMKLKEYLMEEKIDNVDLLGPKFGVELEELYMNSRCVVIPALWYENMPNVALEAMIHSRPIIATGHGSLKEIIKDIGLMFPAGDAKALRKELDRIFKDSKLCQKLGKLSFERSKKYYDPEKHYEKLIEVLRCASR